MEALPFFRARDRISDHRSALLRSDGDDFLVVNEAGRYLGVATRGRLLQPPRARLVLVDHNELGQAVAGAEEAQIVAVLDHHRLGNPPTALPIPFTVEPVGSTCTLVAEQCRARALPPPAPLAGMMLSGILSDTLVFRSPTATERDRTAAGWLAGLCQADITRYGEELLQASPGLGARDAGEIVDADRKSYQIGGKAVSIAQVEVTGLQELPQRRDELLPALQERRERESLALMCLMITDVVAGRSRLLCQGERSIRDALPFGRVDEHEWDLGEIISRKKQLVPTLSGVLEEIG
jgi:manganese-dependent inorganic pyrophosphatase